MKLVFMRFFLILIAAALLFVNYKAWFGDWAEKHYEYNKSKFPANLIALGGKRFYILYYKLSAIFVLIFIIAMYVLFLL